MTPGRRAFTQVVRSAPIDRFGAAADAAALEAALDVSDAREDDARAYTHGFHPYPARMHPLTARRAIELVLEGAGPGPLLDPFSGSGTVLVEALAAGRNALGVDANPLAVSLARVKTAVGIDRRALVDLAHRIAIETYAAGKDARRAGGKPPPPEDTTSPRARELKGWFQPHVRRELEALLGYARAAPAPLIEPLELVLTSLLVKLSKRESDTDEGRVERQLGRGLAARLFATRAEELAAGLDALAKTKAPKAHLKVRLGDARKLGAAGVPEGEVAAIVSSPPYAGTYDYEDQHALRLAFLDRDDQGFEKTEIGARRAFARDLAGGLVAWERDLAASLAGMARALRPGGRAILLVGDSLAGHGLASRALFADDLLVRLAPAAGLTLIAAASQARLALGGHERRAFETRPKREHLVLLRRT